MSLKWEVMFIIKRTVAALVLKAARWIGPQWFLLQYIDKVVIPGQVEPNAWYAVSFDFLSFGDGYYQLADMRIVKTLRWNSDNTTPSPTAGGE